VQNVEFVNVKPGGIYSKHWALKGLITFCNKYFYTWFPNSDANMFVNLDYAVFMTETKFKTTRKLTSHQNNSSAVYCTEADV
jgi:hypothetical protein